MGFQFRIEECTGDLLAANPEAVMEELRNLDEVAYVRFASVYREFRDIDEFMNELKDLFELKKKSKSEKK